MASGIGVLYFALVVFAIVLAICWIVLPFALIGTKPLLRRLLEEQRRANDLLGAKPILRQILDEQRRTNELLGQGPARTP